MMREISGMSLPAGRAAILAAAVAGGLWALAPVVTSEPAMAAAQSGSEGFPDIPIPKRQRKIALADSKDFAEGALRVEVLSLERTAAEVRLNDSQTVRLKTGALAFAAIEEARICTLTYLGKSGAKAIVAARCDPASEELRAALAAQEQASDGAEIVSPADLVAATAKGGLENPFRDSAAAIAEGRRLFLANSCNGCHGGSGGGGMGPPLSNAVWVYGPDDDTLFRLVTSGSDELLADGYHRIGRENVVGPMPPFGEIIEDSNDLWKIIAFVRSIYNDDPSKKSW